MKVIYFGNTYIGEVVKEEYNKYSHCNILTIITRIGTFPKIRDPKGQMSKWRVIYSEDSVGKKKEKECELPSLFDQPM